jgi:hypothetical protein
MISKNKGIFVIYDQPSFAGMKMFLAFIILLLSFIFFISFPFDEHYLSYLSIWVAVSFFFLLREKKEIDSHKKVIINTIYLWKFKSQKEIKINGFEAIVVKLFWENVKGFHVNRYTAHSKQVIGGASVFILNIKLKKYILLETFSTHEEAKSLINFCTNELNLEIRDEYQERVDSSKMKRKFGMYK